MVFRRRTELYRPRLTSNRKIKNVTILNKGKQVS